MKEKAKKEMKKPARKERKIEVTTKRIPEVFKVTIGKNKFDLSEEEAQDLFYSLKDALEADCDY